MLFPEIWGIPDRCFVGMKEASSEESLTIPNEAETSRICRSLGPVSLDALGETNAPKVHRRCILFFREEQGSPLGVSCEL